MKSLKGNRTRPSTVAEGPFRRLPADASGCAVTAVRGRRSGGRRGNALRRRAGDGPAGGRSPSRGRPGVRAPGNAAGRRDLPPGREAEDERPRGGAGERGPPETAGRAHHRPADAGEKVPHDPS